MSKKESSLQVLTERIQELEATEKVYLMNRDWIEDAKVKLKVAEEALKFAKTQLWHNYDKLSSVFNDREAMHTSEVWKVVSEALAKIRGDK